MIYLDSSATTLQKPKSVLHAVRNAMQTMASPGRGGYAAAMAAGEAVFACRTAAAALFSAEPEQVVFTTNATHALNIALHALVSPGARVVCSGFEHNAVMRPLTLLGANVVIAGRKLFDPADTLRAFDEAITTETAAVVCTHVSNVFGYILPVRGIAAICKARGVPFVLDASQSAGCLPVSLQSLGAAYIAMPGHKGLYGPQGTGILLCGEPMPTPLMAGGTGSQSALLTMPDFLPDRLEAGTHNVPGICGLTAGIRFVLEYGEDAILHHEKMVMEHLIAPLRAVPEIQLFTARSDCQTGVLSLIVKNMDCEDVAEKLAKRGVAVRAGLHCAPIAHESAGTLEPGTVRLSVSVFNTSWEGEHAAAYLKALAQSGDSR
ncbi:MAG: aminotransferase class V-fold PLP-dependent enzyme [Oscillospiraceae bacterium]|nr:aminotransferase class V-fold PLP-dependent enzyme [Oscillospiraceae bacterium]